MTIARSMVHGHSIQVDFPDEEDEITLVRARPLEATSKRMPWSWAFYLCLCLMVAQFILTALWLAYRG